ncbi:MAG: multiubiquitin domain-containing protein [Melioribacteraceae bacterium]
MIIESNEIIDIEEYSKSNKKIPKCKRYRIRIDRTKYVVSVSSMNGKELLELANKIPGEEYAIYQKLCGGVSDRINLDEKVDFRTPGIERFVTLPLDQTEGRENLRHMFNLSESDLQYFSKTQLNWETIIENGTHRLVIYDYPIPAGFNIKNADLNLRLEASYPDVQIDMVYFYPALNRMDNIPIRALAIDNFDGKIWQRWSRHRTGKNPWRPDVDDISTHLLLVNEWLRLELEKRK